MKFRNYFLQKQIQKKPQPNNIWLDRKVMKASRSAREKKKLPQAGLNTMIKKAQN